MTVPTTPTPPDHDHEACQRVREEAAVALLTRSAPADVVRAHLDACPPCGDEFAELAALPPLLEAARELADEVPVRPRPVVLERLLAAVARRRRRRRGGVALLAAAAVAAVVTAVAGPGRLGGSGDGDEPPAGAQAGVLVAMGSGADPVSGALAHVDVRSQAGRSAVEVDVRGLAQGTPCHLVLHAASGSTTEVGHWTAGAGENTYVETVDTPATDISRIELLDERGKRIVEVVLRPV